MTTNRRTTVLWCLIAVYLLVMLATTITDNPIPALTTSLLIVIATVHALRRFSVGTFLVFAAITFVVSNIYENVSILTGFPFGNYYYSEFLGPQLFLVPLLIGPAYFATGYVAWTLAHVLLGIHGSNPRGRDVVLVPVVASFVMVMWDLLMDPMAATIGGSWIWEDGGSYFGVPISNFLGWLLCVYTIFQLFAFYLARRDSAANSAGHRNGTTAVTTADRSYWYQAVVVYFIVSLPLTLRSFVLEDRTLSDPAGQPWSVQDISQSTTLVGIFTMWFVSLLSALLVERAGHRDRYEQHEVPAAAAHRR